MQRNRVISHRQMTKAIVYTPKPIRSERSNSWDLDTKINTSFELDSSFGDHKNPEAIPIKKEVPKERVEPKPKIVTKAEMNRRNEIKREYLNKLMTRRLLNFKHVYHCFRSIPSIFFKGCDALEVAQSILTKTRLNVEISLLRSLIYVERKQKNTKKDAHPYFQKTRDITIYPSASHFRIEREKSAIFAIAGLLSQRIKHAAQKFKLNLQCTKSIQRYFRKMISSYNQKRGLFFRLIKYLPNDQKLSKTQYQNLVKNRIQLIYKFIEQKIHLKTAHALTNLKFANYQFKVNSKLAATLLIERSKARKEFALIKWGKIAKQLKQSDEMAELIQKQKKLSQKIGKAKEILQRIVYRNYFKLFRQVIRRMNVYKIVATRLACCSKINIQKSLWRLRLNIE